MGISDTNRWHASWIIPGLIAVAVAWAAAGAGLEMMPLIVIISAGLLLSVALLWVITDPKKHLFAKIALTVLLFVLGLLTMCWVVKQDRPILQPQINGVISQNGSSLGLDIETLIKNAGRQSSYADKWQLDLEIDGTIIEGDEIYGQKLPSFAIDEPEIYNQEFPPGKPVRGWLFFSFPTLSHDFIAPYLICNSVLTTRVNLKLSVWDSKTNHEWSQTRNLKDIGKEACSAIQPTPINQSVVRSDKQEGSKSVPLTDGQTIVRSIEREYHLKYPNSESRSEEKDWINAELVRRGYTSLRVIEATEQPCRPALVVGNDATVTNSNTLSVGPCSGAQFGDRANINGLTVVVTNPQ